jgi:hypothetical protein
LGAAGDFALARSFFFRGRSGSSVLGAGLPLSDSSSSSTTTALSSGGSGGSAAGSSGSTGAWLDGDSSSISTSGPVLVSTTGTPSNGSFEGSEGPDASKS